MEIDPGVHEAREEQILLLPENVQPKPPQDSRKLLWRLGLSFFLFGLVNNVLYVVILSAALDLVPPFTPKGIIAFCNIFPSLIAKLGWPYFLKGRVRYTRRLIGCCALSVSGMVVVSMFDSLYMRLLGISFASFSGGLGELTFLQLSTRYHPPSVAGRCVGYFASGTGAAGLVGAFLWWEIRGFGVRIGVGLSSVGTTIHHPIDLLPAPPRPSDFELADFSVATDISDVPYTPLSSDLVNEADQITEEAAEEMENFKYIMALSPSDKWQLMKPLLAKYMLPLFCVYLFEYTINQGVAPTLVYPVPSPDEHWFISKIIHSIRDYYPLWQLVYQSAVFLPVIQALVLGTLALESAKGIFGGENRSFALVFSLIGIEGICGGLAYVNVYHRVNQEQSALGVDAELAEQEREFKIGSIGLADSTGILLASLLAVPTEVELCKAQVARGKMFCKSL